MTHKNFRKNEHWYYKNIVDVEFKVNLGQMGSFLRIILVFFLTLNSRSDLFCWIIGQSYQKIKKLFQDKKSEFGVKLQIWGHLGSKFEPH